MKREVKRRLAITFLVVWVVGVSTIALVVALATVIGG